MNTYRTSTGQKISKSEIDRKTREAKRAKIEQMYERYGYIFCEECRVNEKAGIPLDCSHDISVDQCQKEGKAELAYDINNITIRCRNCHQKHDKTYINQ